MNQLPLPIQLEQAIKRQKHSFRHLCPACQGVDVPF